MTRLVHPAFATRVAVKPLLYTKEGYLRAYCLGCGHVDSTITSECKFMLYMVGGVYHVRGHRLNPNSCLFWDTFDKLKDARARYLRAIRDYSIT